MVRKPKCSELASEQPQCVVLKSFRRWMFRSNWCQSFFGKRQHSHRVWISSFVLHILQRNLIKPIGDRQKLQFCAPNTSRSHVSGYPKGNICYLKQTAFPQYFTPKMWAEIDFRMKVSPQFDYNINNTAKIFLMLEVFQ